MAIKAGDKMPAGTFKTMTKDGPQDLTSDQLFKGKTVVLFSVPGAFTPTCDAKHLPGFVGQAARLQGEGRRHDRVHGRERRVRDGCLGQTLECRRQRADAGRRQWRLCQGAGAGNGRPRIRHGHARTALRRRRERRCRDATWKSKRRKSSRSRLPKISCRNSERYFFDSSMSFSSSGTIVKRSPTNPRSATSKIGASASLLIATIVRASLMPVRC